MRKRDIPAGGIGSDIVPCHQCDGTGETESWEFIGYTEPCPYCGGDGEIVGRIDYINPEPEGDVANS